MESNDKLCPFMLEVLLRDLSGISESVARALTNNGAREPTDEETNSAVNALMNCTDKCAAWNNGRCLRMPQEPVIEKVLGKEELEVKKNG